MTSAHRDVHRPHTLTDAGQYNLATQVRPGPNARIDTAKHTVADAMDHVGTRQLCQLGIPRIGAGIGGLDWAEV